MKKWNTQRLVTVGLLVSRMVQCVILVPVERLSTQRMTRALICRRREAFT